MTTMSFQSILRAHFPTQGACQYCPKKKVLRFAKRPLDQSLIGSAFTASPHMTNI